MTEVWKADELKFYLPVMYDGRYILLPGGLQCVFSNFLETKHAHGLELRSMFFFFKCVVSNIKCQCVKVNDGTFRSATRSATDA